MEFQEKGNMPKRKATKKSRVDLRRTTHKLQSNEELRLIIGKMAISIRIVSSSGGTATPPPTPRPSPTPRPRPRAI